MKKYLTDLYAKEDAVDHTIPQHINSARQNIYITEWVCINYIIINAYILIEEFCLFNSLKIRFLCVNRS